MIYEDTTLGGLASLFPLIYEDTLLGGLASLFPLIHEDSRWTGLCWPSLGDFPWERLELIGPASAFHLSIHLSYFTVQIFKDMYIC